MANKYANLIGTNLIKDEYTKINTGFDAVETDIANHGTAADPHDQYALDTDLATLQTEVEAHKAGSVQDAGGVHGLEIEEGTWTPTIAGSTIAGEHTYTTQAGSYIKIGNIVTCHCRIVMTSKDVAMAGAVRIAGLPFRNRAGIQNRASGAIQEYYNVDLSNNTVQLACGVAEGENRISFLQLQDNGIANLLDSPVIADTTRFSISVQYFNFI